jgi:hypothetical protein
VFETKLPPGSTMNRYFKTQLFLQTLSRLMKLRFAVILLLLVPLAACGPKMPDWSVLLKNDPVINKKVSDVAPETSDDLVVYLDTSKSMAGYISSDPERPSIFSRTLQEVRNVSTILSPPLNVYVRRVSTEVSGSLNETYLSEASVKQKIFDGSETNLSGAIDSFSLPVEAATTQSSAVSTVPMETVKDEVPQPPARFHILITDGVQSLKRSGDDSCTTGSDQICVRKKILALLSKGWGGYVIGIRSEFTGKLFSEVNHAVIPYTTQEPESFRPFYLYVFSPNHAALDQLQAALRERLRALLPSEDAMRSVALTSAYSDGLGRVELQVEKSRAASLTVMPAPEEKPSRATIKVSLNTENGSPQPFTVVAHLNWSDNVKQSGTPEELARLVKWELKDVYSGSTKGNRLSELRLTSVEPQSDGSVRLGLTAQWPKANGTPDWRGYVLQGQLDLEKPVPNWVKQWSCESDTSRDMGNRTLYLESALLGLWHNPSLEKQIVFELYLRVGEK